MPDRFSIPWRLKAGACLASVTLPPSRFVLIHIVNGHVMSTLVDTDPKYYQAKGLIAFEIEGPGNLKISYRNVWLKKLP
ncbi:MAG: hypothetical protein QOJ42_1593 [Acidobacteriaceae bacterium]|jgi:hypothetical protein|nr:hypothetical protein [Acidobacteriaceae bacterium]MEA3007967.1 hypothetical protein [Acidobacteriaceae bacterium]